MIFNTLAQFCADHAVLLYLAAGLIALEILICLWRRANGGTLNGFERQVTKTVLLALIGWPYVFFTVFFEYVFSWPIFTWRFWLREVGKPGSVEHWWIKK
jgi:hypothetical protein